jgi:putative ABC transport system ATP-binding protein
MTISFAPELIGCRNVSVLHGAGTAQVTALSDIDLAVRPGERLALHGPSGSGKTTLLHVLGGLVVPTRGVVSWQGEPLSTLDAAGRGRARAGGIAFVFQSSNLLPTFTAFENVAFAAAAARARAADGRTDGGARRAIAPDELLGLVGLAAKLDALPAELSGGEAQRVALARALAQQPQLLLCDEPTGHLDSDTGARVLDLIDALQAEFAFAQITATHDADVVARYPRDVALRDGRVLAAEVSA